MADIFLSYARKDLAKVKQLEVALKEQGWSVFWDRTALLAGQDFEDVIEKEIKQAACMVVVWSAASKGSDWVRGEANIGRERKILVPILIDLVEPPIAFRALHTENFATWNGNAQSDEFIKLRRAVARLVGSGIGNPPVESRNETPPQVDISHLPEPTTSLIGRKNEIEQLTEAFTNPNKRLAIIVAAGGIGKSALTDEWLQQIAEHNYYGKTQVFGWSFYSQGSHNTFTNSQPFFSAVLPFFGVTEIPKDEIEKARLLARCLQQQPCLLILDGLEPLQYAQNLAAMNGELQDSALKEFIACFRRTAGNSFLLISSRQPLVELKKWQPEHYLSLDLKTLPHDDGAALLEALGVTGKADERQAISKDLNGHALSLVLMGHLLKEYHDGDCRCAKELPSLTSAHSNSDAEKDSRHALRVLDYYDSLQDAASSCFLQLLGLFDRPMNAAEKAVLIVNAQHAEPLRALTAKQWQAVEQQLEKSGLLLGKKGSFERLEWDTHPIIRAYFGEKFKEDYPEEFKQAHYVLFDYYQKLPEKEFGKYLPDTLDEMLPLYRAVMHGCLAGEYKTALDGVYWQCIFRGDQYFNWTKLGTFSQDIIALSAFFPQGWLQPIGSGLTKSDQGWLLAQVSYCFKALGRLAEAVVPCQATIKLREEFSDWVNVTNSAANLIELLLLLGNLQEAEATAHQTIKYALLTGDKWLELSSYSQLAKVLHRLGQLKLAQAVFAQSEWLQQQTAPDNPYLYTVRGAWYCELLVDTASTLTDLEQVLQRGDYALQLSQSQRWLLDIAFDHLSLARTYQALQQSQTASTKFNLAVQGIQNARNIDDIPQFYLARADFYLTQNQLDPAQADLNSAWEIIERCGMKLYAVDYLLIHGRYCLATADFDTALNHYEEAKQLIQETSYHLRDAELDLFAAQLRQQCGEKYRSSNPGLYSQTADFYLQKTKNRIEEIGQWGLLRVIQRDFPEFL